MHDFSTPDADEMYYTELARRVRFHKQDEKGVQTMCKIVEEYGDERAAEALQKGIELGEKKGIEIGAQNKSVETATNMIKKKYPVSDISEITGLPLENVLELQKTITVNA